MRLPHPGGCAIGQRPINLFIDAFTAMGARHSYRSGIHSFSTKHGLHGTHYIFPVVSVTGTETVVLAAVLARGTTVIANAAREPEIEALCQYLVRCGAHIQGIGTSTITIRGVKQLRGGVATVIPDRIETLSFLFLALAAKQKLTIRQCQPEHVTVPLHVMPERALPSRDTASRCIRGSV